MAEEKWVVFRLAGEMYGVSIQSVREIVPPQRVTPMPGMPVWAEGVTNLRGRVIPVLDLARRMGLPPQDPTTETRIMIVEADAGEFGCVVDAVDHVVSIPTSAVQPAPVQLTVGLSAVHGIARLEERLVVLLKLDVLLHGEAVVG